MGDLHEIVEAATVEKLFVLLALLGPAAGLLLGAFAGIRSKNVRRNVCLGLLIGLCGPLNWLLWRVYNLVTERNGLDTVRNLVVNLVLFVLVGVALGCGVAWIRQRLETGETAGESGIENP